MEKAEEQAEATSSKFASTAICPRHYFQDVPDSECGTETDGRMKTYFTTEHLWTGSALLERAGNINLGKMNP